MIIYEELDNFDSIRHLNADAAGALCFYGEKLVLVYAKDRGIWEMPGGGREDGETFEECIVREIKEESNMKVLELFPLGYDTVTDTKTEEKIYQIRFAAKVEPYGPFVSDPAGDITDMKLINPDDYKKDFDWGERGDQMMKKAKEMCLKY
ncbi:MAG: NUDIX domain-containing protein [Candidatus Taylorbacteria bacterium]|nr:NUDIX domain-containing protein [Candidatus Taylorbacteria bacterium]